MEQVATKIVTKMVSADLISEGESDLYNYGVQVILEKVISYAIIFVLAMIMHKFLEILLFFVSFSILRKYSGGIHCKTFKSCLIISALVSFSGMMLLPTIEHNKLLYQGGVVMSIVVLIILGSINNPNIDWSDCEYKSARRMSRTITVFETSVLLLLIALHTSIKIRFFISYGIVVCAISMLLEIRKRGGIAYEECRETDLEGGKSSCKEAD